jgi:nitroreductase
MARATIDPEGDPMSKPPFDLAETDRLLSTTRAVRKRLDLDRDVEQEVLLDCLRLSQQAPTGSNSQGWRWLIIRDAEKKARLAELYRKAGEGYLSTAVKAADKDGTTPQTKRVLTSALYLVEHLATVPVHVIPCISGKPSGKLPQGMLAGLYGSIFPAIWSFQLALRSRGLGTVLTTLHLAFESEAAELLGIPDDVSQVALLPVAYTKGTDFQPARRSPVERIVHLDSWGSKADA